MPALKKILKTILITFAILITIIFLVILYYFQVYRTQPAADPAEVDQLAYSTESAESLPDTLRRLSIDNLYWENRLAMAADKSIDLLLDLVSRQIFIEIQGVTVYSTPVLYYTTNDSLQRLMASDSLLNWLSQSCMLQSEWATVAKEPIQVREIRPRSEGENGLTHFRDPEDDTYVNILLGFSGNLCLSLKQIEADTNPAIKAQLPVQHARFRIEVFVTRSSALTIYRAIAVNSTNLSIRPE